jgi:hypothetical protein
VQEKRRQQPEQVQEEQQLRYSQEQQAPEQRKEQQEQQEQPARQLPPQRQHLFEADQVFFLQLRPRLTSLLYFGWNNQRGSNFNFNLRPKQMTKQDSDDERQYRVLNRPEKHRL